MTLRWLNTAQLLALLGAAAGCTPAVHAPSEPAQSESGAGASAPKFPREFLEPVTPAITPTSPPVAPTGPDACAAAGGRCVIGGFQNCAERGPHNCNPNLNPGGAFCCLKDLAPTGTSRPAPAIDAGTAAGSGAAGAGGAGAVSDTDADGGSDPGDYYACQTDADCAVKNVGNCCGYYPRCVNKDSVIPPYVCPPGVGSVCGWPDIDACSCRQGTCRSLQNGNEI